MANELHYTCQQDKRGSFREGDVNSAIPITESWWLSTSKLSFSLT